jgi:hypothetical protein
VREQMREMNARLERIGAHVERIDARVCLMERSGSTRAPPARDALGPWAVHLLDLPPELLAAIATQVAEEDELAFALACRRLRQAVAGTKRGARRCAAVDEDRLSVLLGGQAGVGRGVL